jgi:hypothetical protein
VEAVESAVEAAVMVAAKWEIRVVLEIHVIGLIMFTVTTLFVFEVARKCAVASAHKFQFGETFFSPLLPHLLLSTALVQPPQAPSPPPQTV